MVLVPIASMVGNKMPNVAMGAGCLDRSHTTVVSALFLLRDGVQGVLSSWGQYRSTLSLNRTRYRSSHPCSEHTRVPVQRLARPAARLHPRGGYSRALSSPSAPKGHGAVANFNGMERREVGIRPCRSPLSIRSGSRIGGNPTGLRHNWPFTANRRPRLLRILGTWEIQWFLDAVWQLKLETQ